MKILLLPILTATLLFLSPAWSQPKEEQQWWFGWYFKTPLNPPEVIREKVGLEYEKNETPIGLHTDFNNDKIKDYIFQSANSLCGTGGCVYKLFDGATNRSLGWVFGEPIIFSEKLINGFPVIHSYGHGNAESGVYATFVFNGKEYTAVSSLLLTGESLNHLFEKLRKLPKLDER